MVDDPTESSLTSRVRAGLQHRGVKAGLTLVIMTIAILVLHHLAADVQWHAVKADIAGISPVRLLAAVAFTATSFAALALYDVVAVESVVPGRVPRHIAAMAGASGYAISNLLGFSWLTGGALRFRIYSSLGLDWSLVADVVMTSWVSFWLGIVLLLGLLMTFDPVGIASQLGLSARVDTAVGLALLSAIVGSFLWLSRARRTIGYRSYRFDLPTGKLAFLQTAAAIFDVLSAALALYVLMPGDLTQNFALFFAVYVMAIGLGILSHAPGGIGVFEATVMAGLGAGGRSDMLAALTLYRVIYYVLPFAITVLVMAAGFLAARRAQAGRIAKALYGIAEPLVPPLAGALVLVSGTILLVSGNLPAETGRLGVLRDVVPLPFVELSHLAASIAGVLLIVVARGLYLKQRRAWLAALLLMAVGFLASLSKGLDWEEALSLLFAFALLMTFRPAFYRSAGRETFRMSWRWVLGSASLIAVVTWIGFFAYSNVPYSNDLWWDFAWHGNAPRFLRASFAVTVIFAAISLNSLMTYRGRPLPPEPIPDEVRKLVAASTNTESNIALTGDKRFLVSDDGTAFLSYADSGGSLVAKGDPVGDHDAGEALIWKLRELADRLGKRCAFYAV